MKRSIALAALLLSALSFAQTAPEIVGTHWLNTTGGKSLTLAARRGKVTVIEFWTLACSNCQANLKAYNRVYEAFHPKGVEVIGIHTPEMEMEHDPQRLREVVQRWNIKYPILTDSDSQNWMLWHQQYWPTIYVVDKTGQITFKWEGELAYNGAGGEQKLTDAIEKALRS